MNSKEFSKKIKIDSKENHDIELSLNINTLSLSNKKSNAVLIKNVTIFVMEMAKFLLKYFNRQFFNHKFNFKLKYLKIETFEVFLDRYKKSFYYKMEPK